MPVSGSTSTPTDLPASTRAVLAALGVEPAMLLIVGGIGAGKSAALEAVRRSLRDAGQRVLTRVPDDLDSDTAVVIDDAHLLTDTDLRRLTEIAENADRTVVVATESRDHHEGLRGLCTALERERPRISLAHTLSPADYPLAERLRRLDEPDLETLLVTSLGSDLGAADLAAVLAVSPGRAGELIDRARGTGLIEPSHPPEFRAAVHRAVAQILGAWRHHDLETALLRTQLDSSTLSAHLALSLAEHGVRDDALVHWLRQHLPDGAPEARARWYRAAVDAGATELRTGLADALALDGDCPAAGALADALLGSPEATERAAGARIAASVATHDGNTAHAAEVFGWLGAYPDATVGAAAAVVHIAAGDTAAARAALDTAQSGPPTAPARAARSLAEGLLLTVELPYPAAAAKLSQAVAGGHTAAALVLPDSAPALVTLAALHSGDAVRARSVITRAVRDGADPVWAARHRLLQGWVRMQDGQLAAAAADADAAESNLHGRDALWAAALRTAIARRGGDAGALHAHWFAGMDVLAEYSIDLFSLLPLGELWMAAARLRQQERMAPALDQAFGVLAALGEPATWSPSLHWAGVHAGILAGDPAAVAPHGQALAGLAERSPLAAALAAAGRTWLRVLARQVDADEAIGAARGLAGFGLTSDATRLAGQAALHTADPKVAALMLQVARDLKLSSGDLPDHELAGTDATQPTPAGRPRPASTTLSDREREVAELLLLGMPYRDIGAQLFISAKTVEHHVARIRRRLGAGSRSEMLSMLRAMLATGE